MQVTEALEVVDGPDGREFRCLRCGQGLGAAAENYKLSCVLEETGVAEGNPHIGDPRRYVDADLVLRRYYCPGCAVLMETEVAQAQDAPLWDIELA